VAGNEGHRLQRPDNYNVQTVQLNKQVRDRLLRVESPFRAFKSCTTSLSKFAESVRTGVRDGEDSTSRATSWVATVANKYKYC
jgi:hypothetical protein